VQNILIQIVVINTSTSYTNMAGLGGVVATEAKTEVKCDLSRLELKQSGRNIDELCPICKQLVGIHQRRLKAAKTSINTKTTKAATTSTSSTRDLL
jgi:hypothetical protein